MGLHTTMSLGSCSALHVPTGLGLLELRMHVHYFTPLGIHGTAKRVWHVLRQQLCMQRFKERRSRGKKKRKKNGASTGEAQLLGIYVLVPLCVPCMSATLSVTKPV
jgi:hypothetical protein